MGLFNSKAKEQAAKEQAVIDQIMAIFKEVEEDFEALLDPAFHGPAFYVGPVTRATLDSFQATVMNHMWWRVHGQALRDSTIKPPKPNRFPHDPNAPFKNLIEAAKAWGYDHDSLILMARVGANQIRSEMGPPNKALYIILPNDPRDEAENALREMIASIMPERMISLTNPGLTNRAKAENEVIMSTRERLVKNHRRRLVDGGDRDALMNWLRVERGNRDGALAKLLRESVEYRRRLYMDAYNRVKQMEFDYFTKREEDEARAIKREVDLAKGLIVEARRDDNSPIDLTGYFKSIIGRERQYGEIRFDVISVDEERKQAWIVAMNGDGKWIGRYCVSVGRAISHNHVFNQLVRQANHPIQEIAEAFDRL